MKTTRPEILEERMGRAITIDKEGKENGEIIATAREVKDAYSIYILKTAES